MNEPGREMSEQQIQQLLRSALPPIESTAPTTDAWPLIAERLDGRPSWTMVDVALAAGIILALTLMPEALFVLALHL